MDPATILLVIIAILICFLFRSQNGGFLIFPWKWDSADESPVPPGLKPVPVLKGLPLAGNIFQFRPDYRHLDMASYGGEMGDIFRINMFGQLFVTLLRPDLIREALVENASAWSLRPQTYRTALATDQMSLFALNNINLVKMMKNTAHKALQVYNPGAPDRMKQHCREVINKFLAQIYQKSQKEPLDVKHDINMLFGKLASVLVRGMPVEDDSAMPALTHKAAEALRGALSATRQGFQLDFFPWLKVFPKWRRVYDSCVRLNSTRQHIWDAYVAPAQLADNDSFVKALLKRVGEKFGEEKDDVVSEKHVQYIMGDLFFGGVVTVSDVMYAMVNFLCYYPDVQEKMAAEVIEYFGENPEGIDLPERGSLPYVRAAIFEIFRFTSITPFIVPRIALKDTVVCGMHIPKGCGVLGNAWAAHHDARFWDEPWEYRPERFLDDQGELLPADHNTRKNLLTFGAGARMCLGNQYAQDSLLVILANMIRRYEIISATPAAHHACDPSKWPIYGITLQVPPYKIRLQPRVALIG